MESTIDINVYLNTLKQKGNLAYEYNPFHNYLTNENLYKVDKFLIPENCAVDPKNGEILKSKNSRGKWVNKRGKIVEDALEPVEENLIARAGSLVDLDTDLLNFDLSHPVELEVQPSYDGSVNIIFNDDKNIPRLINSRFSVREKDTYEIVDRIGENDTNIYNSKTFEKDTSLYFQYNLNPTVKYLGYISGNLLVGSYCFYFTYCDADDNESDIITESGIIPTFIGDDGNPFSMDGGIKNQTSNKGIKLRLDNIDKSYNYIKVYYVRYFADYQQNKVHECKKIVLKYSVNSNVLILQITGNETTEDVDSNLLNIERFNPKSVLTLALCKNMLFFGNIVKNTDNYKELLDCALRIIPNLSIENIDLVDNNYSKNRGYYTSTNMYNKVGYFPQEYYRFGVVFIYLNGTLSNVYNTLGYILKDKKVSYKEGDLFNTENEAIQIRKYITIDDKGWIHDYPNQGVIENANSRGVCKIDYDPLDNEIIGVNFNIPNEVSEFLKNDLGIRGLFFVRQKCIPTILALCYLLPMDDVLNAPVIEYQLKNSNDKYTTIRVSESFVTQKSNASYEVLPFGIKKYKGIKPTFKDLPSISEYEERRLTLNYLKRLYKYNGDLGIGGNSYAAICPDFLLNLPYYNLIFNGSDFIITPVKNSNKGMVRSSSNPRFYVPKGEINTDTFSHKVTICTVTDDVSQVALRDKSYKLEIGKSQEAFRFGYASYDSGTYDAGGRDVENPLNIIRGKYSPYLAIYSPQKIETGVLYLITKESYGNLNLEFLDRMNSFEPFYAISNRYNFELFVDNELTCFRGDCYINQFTYRLNRNFNDSSLPNNDVIIDVNTWRENYNPTEPTEWKNISLSDINAVQLGSWFTFKVRSAMNYALRSVDHSYVAEEALMGAPRSFFPKSELLYRGNNKLPESYLYNDAFRTSLGFKCYFTVNDVNYIKNTFSNRILYSSIAILDSFKNNYRDSLSTYSRDYSQEYGSIQKLIGFEGYLLVIFEHAIAIAVINERILVGQSDGEPVFINTKNVLPQELTIITDTYGTQWGESVVKSEAGYVYGVDTVAKKIWRVKGREFEILSDFKVNSFLIKNISLGEREVNPFIGLKNVKTHYNNNKKDVMFTFYDDIYKDEEKVWNLCYNELLGEFVTFYSWIPSYSANIDNQFFTFNRDVSKSLSLLNKSNYHIEGNVGILLDSPILKIENGEYSNINIYYKNKVEHLEKILFNDTINVPRINYIVKTYDIEHDHWGAYNWFEIIYEGEQAKLKVKDVEAVNNWFSKYNVLYLELTPENEKTETIALTTEEALNKLKTNFYLHGQAGKFKISEPLLPTHWYDEYHPFEFEIVVNDKIGYLKIFSNLVIISNKAEPESFHFEIEGDNLEFSSDKRTMYFRLEATKELFQNLGSDMLFDRNYTDVTLEGYTKEQHYRGTSEYTDKYSKLDRVYPVYREGLVLQVKSTIFPLYYEKVDTYNEIYHKYREMLDGVNSNYDFKNLSGSEIKWYKDLNQFNIVTHIKNNPIPLVGRIRGNSFYKEGKWEIQIPSIIFNLKNELNWNEINERNRCVICESKLGKTSLSGISEDSLNLPPIVLNSSNVPSDIKDYLISQDKIPNIYSSYGYLSAVIDNSWTFRKEARIRDKWVKIRVRYSGKNLAVIHSLITLYNISYS